MSYFLPAYFQKRLLRYALSRLDLFDTDGLELDKLDIAWGKRSTVELRDVALCRKKIASLSGLSQVLELTAAKVLLLRVTVPADIYSSAIVIEIEGVLVHAKVLPETHSTTPQESSARSEAKQLHTPGNGSNSKVPQRIEVPAHEHRRSDYGGRSSVEGDGDSLPTAVDLAHSFLQVETLKEKAELKTAVESQMTVLSDEEEAKDDIGTGTGLTLPGFLAAFLHGVQNRMEVLVRDILVDLVIDIRAEEPNGSLKTDQLTLRFQVESILVEGVTSEDNVHDKRSDVDSTCAPSRPDGNGTESRRRACIQKIHFTFISDHTIFSNLPGFSSGSAPPKTQSENARESTRGGSRFGQSCTPLSSASNTPTPITSTSGALQPSFEGSVSTDPHQTLGNSIDGSGTATSDSGGPYRSVFNSHVESSHNSTTLPDRTGYASMYYNVSEETSINLHANKNEAPAEDAESEHSYAFRPDNSHYQPYNAIGTASGLESLSDMSRNDSRSKCMPIGAGRLYPLERPPQSTASQQSAYSQLAQTDNYTHGIQVSNLAATYHEPDPQAAVVEDLSVSRIFSHDEAESMYMSAMSQVLPAEGNRMAALEGSAWSSAKKTEDENLPCDNGPTSSIEDQHLHQLSESLGASKITSLNFKGDDGEAICPAAPPPEPQKDRNSPSQHNMESPFLIEVSYADATSHVRDNTDYSSNSPESISLLKIPVLYIDQVEISVPCLEKSSLRSEKDQMVMDSSHSPEYGSLDNDSPSFYSNIPGAFSMYTQRSRVAPKTSIASSVEQTLKKPAMDEGKPAKKVNLNTKGWESKKRCESRSTQVDIGHVDLDLDVFVGRSLAITATTLKTALKNHNTDNQQHNTQQVDSDALSWNINVRSVACRLHELVRGTYSGRKLHVENIGLDHLLGLSARTDVLLHLTIGGLGVRYSFDNLQSSTQISFEELILGHSEGDIISFDAGLKLTESIRDMSSPPKKDGFISIIQAQDNRRLSIHTLPVRLTLSLGKMDEIMNWFGGLSGILELGTSIASSATTIGADATQKRRLISNRSVHFSSRLDKDSAFTNTKENSLKIDVRLGGAQVNLIGKDCTFVVKTSAMKFVSRGECSGLQVDKIIVSGPNLDHSDVEGCLTAEVNNTRVELLAGPTEADLDRLLSLLTPSKNKYDDDDDILVETLLRQRRKGSLIRTTTESLHGSISCPEDILYLSNLMTEVANLAKVAKYLPEDDRPGILVLTLVRDVDAAFYVDKSVGHLRLTLQNLESANVALPLLMAIGIEVVRLHRNQDEELIGLASSLGPHTDHRSDGLMVMARVIGDEIEPTIRVKLWDVLFEHRVPLMVAFTAESENKMAESLIGDLLSSVITIAAKPPHTLPYSSLSRLSPPDPGLPLTTKLPKLEISLLDCIVGLNPRDSLCKGLVVLTDTRLSGKIRSTHELEAILKVNKTSILITDDDGRNAPLDAHGTVAADHPQLVHGDQITRLCQKGFVSVGYLSSARAAVFVTNFNKPGIKSVDIDLRDDLFVLETCADSTQTLLGIIDGLKPPVVPSKDNKYRTEIIPVQDMLASLSGDAFAPTTPFADEETQAPLDLEEGDLINDEVPQNLEYVSSFYRSEPQTSSEEIADSILEDDLGQMVNLPVTREIGDKILLQSFQEQYEVAAGGEPLDFREDHFATNSTHADSTSGWHSKYRNLGANNTSDTQMGPLRVRVRDVHVIWKLYDGYDWPRTRDTISKAVKSVEKKATKRRVRSNNSTQSDPEDEQESVIGDYLFNSIYIGIPAKRDPQDLTGVINRNVGSQISEIESFTASNVSRSQSRISPTSRVRRKGLHLGRSKHHKMSFELRGVSLDLAAFAPAAPAQPDEVRGSLDIRVRDLEIFDHVPTSTWKKFATYMHDAGERQSGSDMVHIEILTVKPVPDLEATEIQIKTTVLPLRLHVDQDALDFVTRFFEFRNEEVTVPTSPSDVIFISRVEVDSVRLRLDYKPKTVDYAGLRSGHTTEFMNFFILDQADMILRHVIIHGISGFDKLSKTLNDVWMPDIKRNQLPGVLAGLAPFRSLVGVGSGMRDLVAVPMREYRKDGRVVRSIQKGAVAFAKTTTSELAKLGAKLAIGTQTVLQSAEDLFVEASPQDLAVWKDAELDDGDKKAISLYADQPVGVVQGLRGAYASLERDLITFRDAIVAVPGEVIDSGSAQGAARAVLRRAPTVIFRPVIGASKAVSQTLMGATNSLDPQNQRRIEDKYKKY